MPSAAAPRLPLPDESASPPEAGPRSDVQTSGWKASLALRFARQGTATRAVERRHHGPLRVQRMLYPEGPACCHALLLHPPGGIAGGDRLDIAVALEEGARALLTTPGAAKWYRAAAAGARQDVHLSVADGACLEWLPQEAILFDGARAAQHATIALAPRAATFGWDIVQLGRLAAGEAWRTGHWHQHFRVTRAGRPVWIERARLAADDPLRASPLGLAGHPVFATAWAASPALDADREAALAAARAVAEAHDVPCGITWLAAPAELLVIRAVGEGAHAVRALLEALWHTLRPWTASRAPQRPRIWNT
ncbi:urease accessory protein UreD [Frateuria defendens]|uniref:urease accessory protein UreD n=1 Tax=Frateuria defendens TaxID=2219559 RepID=UPI0007DC2F87|nr:urease accessory protein UreD [Frateuria defendens]